MNAQWMAIVVVIGCTFSIQVQAADLVFGAELRGCFANPALYHSSATGRATLTLIVSGGKPQLKYTITASNLPDPAQHIDLYSHPGGNDNGTLEATETVSPATSIKLDKSAFDISADLAMALTETDGHAAIVVVTSKHQSGAILGYTYHCPPPPPAGPDTCPPPTPVQCPE